MQTVSYVNIERFMGDWYVAAGIPTFPERDAYNPLESYSLNADGTIETRFAFNKGPGGPSKVLKAKGFVQPASGNAIWGMQFIWPIKAEYRIVYLDPEYQYTIIGRSKRDYLWIMSRQPAVDKAKLNELIDFAKALGYDESSIQLTNWQLQLQDAG